MGRYIWRNVGYDESNHGRVPEICVAVAGKNDGTDCLFGKFSKQRDHRGIVDRLRGREYRFLMFGDTDKSLIPGNKKLGVILGSLASGERFDKKFNVYIDGLWNYESLCFARGVLGEITSLGSDKINLFDDARLDRKMNLVNIADEVAHWLLNRPKSFESLRSDRHRKEILIDLVDGA
jgi:hypothetical protein